MHPNFKYLVITIFISLSTSLFLTPFTIEISSASTDSVKTKDIRVKADELNKQGIEQFNQGKFREALKTFETVLGIFRQIGDRTGEATVINNIGQIYHKLGEYPKALEYYQQVLLIAKATGDGFGLIIGEGTILRRRERKRLFLIGGGIRRGEATIRIGRSRDVTILRYKKNDLSLNNYSSLNDLAPNDLDTNSIREGIFITKLLNNLGRVYYDMGKQTQALDYFQQALDIAKKNTISKVREINIAGIQDNIAVIYFHQGEYDKTKQYYLQNLAIYQKNGDELGQADVLNNLGEVHRQLGKYPKAFHYLNQALELFKIAKDYKGIGATLNNIGLVHDELGQLPKALEFYQKSLKIRQENNDRIGVGTTLHNIGLVYDQSKKYQQALEIYNQALVVRREVSDKAGEARTLNNIALVHNQLGDYPKALNFLQQALSIFTKLGYPVSEANTLDSLGTVYQSLKNYSKAFESFQEALAISRKAGNRSLEKVTLSNIANLLTEQNQPELAIIFYKQSVNIIEKIRNDLKVLPEEQQKSYTTTVAHIYRNLADLLLQQNRIIEAQRVLDLLKVQELDDYLTNVRGNKQTSSGIELLPQEQKVALQLEAIQGKEILTGKELTQLRKLCKPKCTAQQEKRISELVNIQQLQRKKFNEFIKSDEVKALLRKLNETAQEQNLRLTNLNNLRDNLQKNAVLFYPLILKDRLELVLVSRDSPPIRRTVSVKREDLNRTIVEFRRALQNPNSNAVTPAKKLYQWLIKPIENDLNQAQTKTIIYSPDGALRYIPLAALHDGKNWLVQRFNTHNITAASIDDLDTPRQTNLRVLAAAFSQGNYTFTVGSQQFNFAGLPFAGKEVENLSKTIQNTTKLLNKTFSADSTIPKMGNYNLVHLATHAAFVLGKPKDSFILFGNGDRVSLRDVENWNLTNVDLIVLSACETGVGDKFGNGEEILGFGYLMQQAGAKTSIASLWRVSDGGTQALMDAFYTALQNPKITKAEALKNAQVALITGDFSALGNQRAGIIVKQRIGKNLSLKISNNLSHPYYWAPFILIGNGL